MQKMTRRRNFCKGLFCLVLCVLLTVSLFSMPKGLDIDASDPFVVMLDPGHGGSDGGAVRGSSHERVFNEKLAAACRKELVTYDNVLVYVTRENNSDISTYARSMYAKRVQADLFVSFHINANDGASANGAEIYVPHGNWKPEIATEAKLLATQILSNFAALELPGYGLANNHLKNRGIQTRLIQNDTRLFYPDGSQGDYYEVIRMGVHNDIPSMIIEHAFISNPADLAMLQDDAALEKLGKATADAIAQQYNLKKTGQTLTQPVLKGQTSVINFPKPKSEATVGGKPIDLTASGGTGTGEYVFYSNNPKVVRIEGNQAYIVGAGTVRLSVTKYEDGTYVPRSVPDINRPSITVSCVQTQLQLSVADNYRGANGKQNVVLSCAPALGTEYGAVPYGTVTFYKDDIKLGTAQFKEDGKCTFTVTDIEPGNYNFKASYASGEFDGFEMNNTATATYLVESTEPTPTPAATLTPTSPSLQTAPPASAGTTSAVLIIVFAVAAVLIIVAIIILLICRFSRD